MSWNYDGAQSLSATVPATIGHTYALTWLSDNGGGFISNVAVGTSITLTDAAMTSGGLTAGDRIAAVVQDVTLSTISISANAFDQGAASTTGITFGATLAYNTGTDDLECTFDAFVVEDEYRLETWDWSNTFTAGPYGADGAETLGGVLGDPPTSGLDFWVILLSRYGTGFARPQLSAVISQSTGAIIDSNPLIAPGGGGGSVNGICVAFDDDALTETPAWTAIDTLANVHITGWNIRRGRQYELDKTAAGTATIQGIDTNGVLDPTNTGGAYFGKLDPTKQAKIDLHNPVTDTWTTIFRGYVADWNYELDVSENHVRFTLELVDALDILADAEVIPDNAGNTVPGESVGDVAYDGGQIAQDRILAALADAALNIGGNVWPVGLTDIFTGNVKLRQTIYSPRSTILSVIQDAADAEFPGVANFYASKTGILTFHGRLARFDPTNPDYGINTWKAGDRAAFVADANTAEIAELRFTRGKTNLINAALATPTGIKDSLISGQFVSDSTSIGLYSARSVSFENLLTALGHDAMNVYNVDANTETKKFATYYVDNYKNPRTRVSQLVFRPRFGAAATPSWALICGVEISDIVTLTTTHPGGGGFAEGFYVEGITYEADTAGGATFDNVTLTLDVSPKAYYDTNPFS